MNTFFVQLQESSTQQEWDDENQKEVQGLKEKLLRPWILSSTALSVTTKGKRDQILGYSFILAFKIRSKIEPKYDIMYFLVPGPVK